AESRGSTLSTQATISTIGFGVGIVGAVVGTYFLVANGGAARPATTARSATASPRVAPWFSGTAGGIEGRF
uniref:hypothetical protein n=1 Tax=Klebsiella pneumoniae TaxID=573 RepID=UPI00300A40FD